MIGYLRGKLSWRSDNNIIIDVQGVGYLVEVPELFRLPPVGDHIEIYTYTYVREDALRLFGFEKMKERRLFELLLSVSGVGPGAAFAVFSYLSYTRFINAILTENVEVLKEVSGIGPKTAQRLILELQGKIDDLAQSMDLSEKEMVQPDELYEALIQLGYSSGEIDNAISSLELDQGLPLEKRIKKVLGYLGKENF